MSAEVITTMYCNLTFLYAQRFPMVLKAGDYLTTLVFPQNTQPQLQCHLVDWKHHLTVFCIDPNVVYFTNIFLSDQTKKLISSNTRILQESHDWTP